METTNIDMLVQRSVRKVRDTKVPFRRFLYDRIDWTDRLIIIKGARGVGKTTLLLQYIKDQFGIGDEALYASLDNLWFTDNRLTDLAEQFYQLGGGYLFLDEVHKYPGWSQEVKNIYDDYPDIQMVLTSSSALHIYSGKGDLSRRAVVYDMPELSLREFIALKEDVVFPAYAVSDLVERHQEISADMSGEIRPLKMLNDYYRSGAYPYFFENPDNYHQRLLQTINTILEVDLPAILNIDYSSVHKLKKLLYVLSTSVPFKPNITELSRKVGVARDTLLRYLHHLSKAHLVMLLRSNKKGMSYLAKPEKIYLYNTNIMAALADEHIRTGTMRETFFYNQLRCMGDVYDHSKADFLFDDKWIFEVGGKNKSGKQIKGLSGAYIVADDIEVGYGNKIPLWLFGFLY